MTLSMQQVYRRAAALILAFVIAFGLMTNTYKPTVAQAAYHQAYIQATVDTAIWEILAGVVDTEASPWETAMEHQRIGADVLSSLAGSDTPSDVTSLIPSTNDPPSGGGGNAEENLVMVFPGNAKSDSVIFRTSSDAQDTARATLVRNSLIYDLNTAFRFVYGDSSGTYVPSGTDVDARYSQYKSDMTAFLSAIPSGSVNGASCTIGSASSPELKGIDFPDATIDYSDYVIITKNGETQVFLYRMPKGYVPISGRDLKSLGLTQVSYQKDAAYVHWGQFVVEAFMNYQCDDKLQVTVDGVYDSTPTAFEKVLASAIGSLCDWVAGALGLWGFDELIFNAGTRGTTAYAGGIFPAAWQTFIWSFFFLMEIVAIGILLYSIIVNVGKKVMSTVNPIARANAIEQIKYLFLVAIILGLLPMAMQLLINVSYHCTGLFKDALGDRTAAARFRSLAANSGSLGSVLTYLIYLGALIYFNIFYVIRSIAVALLIVFAPIFVACMGISESKRQLTMTWFKELLANLFIQPLQAIMLCFILMLPSTGRNFESIVLAYVMIPLTSMLRTLFFGSSGGLAGLIAERGKGSAVGLAKTAGGVAAGAAVGGVGAIQNFRNSKNGTESGGDAKSDGDKSSAASNSGETQAPKTKPSAAGAAAAAADVAAASGSPSAASGDKANTQAGTSPSIAQTAQTSKSTQAHPVQAGTSTGSNGASNQAAAAVASGNMPPNQEALNAEFDSRSDNTGQDNSPEQTQKTDDSKIQSEAQNGAESKPDTNSTPSKHQPAIGSRVGAVAALGGAIALGAVGGAQDQFNRRVFGISAGPKGGLITQLSRNTAANAGTKWSGNKGDASSASAPEAESSQPPQNPRTYTPENYQSAIAEDRLDNPNSDNVFARGHAEYTKLDEDNGIYYVDSDSLKDAGVKNVRSAGKGSSVVSYTPDKLGIADNQRLGQLMTIWQQGSQEERAAMMEAGITNVQPVTRMVDGEARTTGVNVTYDNDKVKQTFGLDAAPAEGGGKGLSVQTPSGQAPRIVPVAGEYLGSEQVAFDAVAARISAAGGKATLENDMVTVSAPDMEIFQAARDTFVTPEHPLHSELQFNQGASDSTYTSVSTQIPRQEFMQHYAPAIQHTQATQPIIDAAQTVHQRAAVSVSVSAPMEVSAPANMPSPEPIPASTPTPAVIPTSAPTPTIDVPPVSSPVPVATPASNPTQVPLTPQAPTPVQAPPVMNNTFTSPAAADAPSPPVLENHFTPKSAGQNVQNRPPAAPPAVNEKPVWNGNFSLPGSEPKASPASKQKP